MQEGKLADVFSFHGEKLGTAIASPAFSIAAQMIAFGTESPEEAIARSIREAAAVRNNLFCSNEPVAYRLIHSEGDGICGLIVDVYAGVVVLQLASQGIEQFRGWIVKTLIEVLKPKAIYEKSTSKLRGKNGLDAKIEHIYGVDSPKVEIVENGLKYAVDVLEGQKTGFFLDQREMRAWVQSISRDKKVLNCFAYTGGFSISALAGGAAWVDSVEISAKCQAKVEENLSLNQLKNHRFICEDVFAFIKGASLEYDLIILDPPAFIQARKDMNAGYRAYLALNQAVMQKAKPHSILITSSCSAYLDESDFQTLLFKAGVGRSIRIIGKHRLAADHPISLSHPESNYLKSFALYII